MENTSFIKKQGGNSFIDYCIKGLERMYIPSEHLFTASRVLRDGQMTNYRNRNTEYLVTMNALLGLNQTQKQGNEIFLDIESDYHTMAKRVEEMAGFPREIAATVWTGRSLGVDIAPDVLSLFNEYIKKVPGMNNIAGKSLAWMIIACLTGDSISDENANNALVLAKIAAERYYCVNSGLVSTYPTGHRRHWASFGEHSYIAYAFLLLARKVENTWARDIGLSIVRKLVSLQGPDGQWAWMYHVHSGRIGDFYPVYSVHQYAYAPFILLEAIDMGYNEFREPLIKGFRWILGQNELSQSMVEPGHQIIWRRMIRTGINFKQVKMLRGMIVAHAGLKPTIGRGIKIDHQCWSFEMALPLCVLGNRPDFNEILNDSQFNTL